MDTTPDPEATKAEHAARPVCRKCHLAIKEGERSIIHGDFHYHMRCAPEPWVAGEKDDDTSGPIGI